MKQVYERAWKELEKHYKTQEKLNDPRRDRFGGVLKVSFTGKEITEKMAEILGQLCP